MNKTKLIALVIFMALLMGGLSFATVSVGDINLIPDLDISRFLPYNITANITNTTELSSVTVNISGINGEGVVCWDYYVNGTCGSEELSFPMADQGEGIWLKENIYPDYIYPEIYFVESDITWYNEPEDIRMWRGNYHLFNFTNSFDMENNMSFWIEFNSIAAAGNSVDLSVYIIGNGSNQIGLDYFTEDWRSKDNTELVATLDRNIAFHHTHTVNSTHHLVALGTNADGTIGSKNINVSEYFWVILYPDSPNTGRGWDLRYHDEILCSNTNAWYTASRTGGTWNSPVFQNGCPDAHIHIARRISNDGINVTVHGVDNETNEDVSSAQFYFGELPNMPPNPTTITYPLENVTYDGSEHGVDNLINISWNPATDPNIGDNLTYTISLYYGNETLVGYLVNDTEELNYEWNITDVEDGDYYLTLSICDDEPLCVNSTMAGNFTIDRTYSGCVNLSDSDTYQGLVVNNSGQYTINNNVTLCQDTYEISYGIWDGAILLNCSNCYLDCNNSIISGDDSLNFGIYVTEDFIDIRNCYVKNYMFGLQIESNNNTLTNITAFDNADIGISLESCSDNILTYCNATNNWAGLLLDDCNSTFILNSSFNENDDYGINLWESNNNTLSNNIVNENNDSGIALESSINNILNNNTACSNLGNDTVDGSYPNNNWANSTYDTSTPDNYIYFDRVFWCNSTPFVPTPINVTLTYPDDLAVFDTNSTTLNFTVNLVSNCSVYTNITGVWNMTSDFDNTEGDSHTTGVLSNGDYIWNVYCEESINASNNAWAEPTNRTFTINYTAPSLPINVTLTYPEDLAVLDTNETTLNYTVNIESFCGVYTNITGVWNRTCDQDNVEGNLSCAVGPLANGNYIWNVYCEDIVNSSNNEWGEGINRTFTINYEELSSCVNLSDSDTYAGKITGNITAGFEVQESLVLCEDIYDFEDITPFQFAHDNLTLDCNGSTLNLSSWSGGGCYGVRVFSFNNITIKNCIITNFVTGIYFRDANYSLIENNIINNSNWDGIFLDSSSNNTITNNNVNYNGWDGIYLDSSLNNIFTNNTLTYNNNGISFSSISDYNVIINNTIENNIWDGIQITSGSNNSFINNIILNNNGGIFLSESINNTFIIQQLVRIY